MALVINEGKIKVFANHEFHEIEGIEHMMHLSGLGCITYYNGHNIRTFNGEKDEIWIIPKPGFIKIWDDILIYKNKLVYYFHDTVTKYNISVSKNASIKHVGHYFIINDKTTILLDAITKTSITIKEPVYDAYINHKILVYNTSYNSENPEFYNCNYNILTNTYDYEVIGHTLKQFMGYDLVYLNNYVYIYYDSKFLIKLSLCDDINYIEHNDDLVLVRTNKLFMICNDTEMIAYPIDKYSEINLYKRPIFTKSARKI